MGKYDDYCKPMFLRQDERPRPNRPGTWVLGQEYRFLTEYAKWSPYVVEYIPLLPADEKAMKHFHGQDDNVFHTANVERDGHKGGGYKGQIRHEAEMLWVFLGTDPENPKDLGAHIDFTLGLDEDAEVLSFDEPCCIHVPRGLANSGMKISNQRRAFLNINILTQPSKEACYIEHTYYPLPTDESVVVDNGSDRHYKCSDVEKELG
ncbi:MAG: hypothetical protein LUF35_14395 [Lachnospiraceae bacterium]|nr:hypothetical protein [Lachnospiraceae bacterium]